MVRSDHSTQDDQMRQPCLRAIIRNLLGEWGGHDTGIGQRFEAEEKQMSMRFSCFGNQATLRRTSMRMAASTAQT